MPKSSTHYDFLDAPTQDGDLGMLGSYRILGELGRGGMGFVFRAVDTVLERPVALKVMNKKVASTPNSRDRFLQEARAMAAVHHDNVVVIFEVGMHEGTPFMAMEMLRGETLEAINAQTTNRNYEQVIEYARQISRGLAAAHAKGIVHRDIKPANIWVEAGTSRVKILDFGLALATSPDSDASGVGSVCGTPGYLTPEQARSDPLDDRSDLYSLGVVLYEMCTGRLPTSQSAIPQQLVALLTGTPKPLRDLNPAIPQPLAELIHQLLAKEPIDRPANAVALEKQLEIVARECEAKSETAMSLSKLQLSLKEVVSKQGEVKTETFDLSAFDDLAVPTRSTTALPGPTNIQSGRSNAPVMKTGVKAGQPLGTVKPFNPKSAAATGKAGPIGSQASRSPASESQPVSPIVWMGAGILGTLLLVLALVWLILPGQTENTVSSPLPTPLPTTPSSPPAPPPNPTPKPSPPVPAGVPETPGASPSTPPMPTATIAADVPVESATDAMTEGDGPGASEGDGPETSRPDSAEAAESATIDTNLPEEPEPASMKVLNINTAVGIGADSTVREAYETSLATKPILLVQKRKGDGEEKQHVHLRFDLQANGVSHADVAHARLGMILSIPGQEKLRDTTFKLYGYDAKGAEAWVENNERKAILWSNSISREGLGSLPLLAQWSSDDPAYTSAQVVFFSSEELAAFIRKASGKTVSFVVSGGNPEGTAVRFLSKEGDATKAPTLMLSLTAPGD